MHEDILSEHILDWKYLDESNPGMSLYLSADLLSLTPAGAAESLSCFKHALVAAISVGLTWAQASLC